MATEKSRSGRWRPFWSGTITFGLVAVPVELHPAIRNQRVSMRMLGPHDRPLERRYVCSEDDKILDDDEIVRGYPAKNDRYIVVTDEELEKLEPRKSRDIELQRFVDRDDIDPMLFERPYVVAPAGQSTRAYHLLAQTMEQRGKAGIATFVMRGREYLAAIFAENGILCAATLRFADELRSPADVGLPKTRKQDAKKRRRMEAALKKLERNRVSVSLLRDEDDEQLVALARRKSRSASNVVKIPVEERTGDGHADVIDLMALLKERLEAGNGDGKRKKKEDLSEASKEQLTKKAKKLGISGHSKMNKAELADAIRAAG